MDGKLTTSKTGRHRVFLIFAALWLTTVGPVVCHAGMPFFSSAKHPLVSSYQPSNYQKAYAHLPKDLHRVAVLPLACSGDESVLADGCEMLDPVMRAELLKLKHFEVAKLGRANVLRSTGRLSWTGAETLPEDFLNHFLQAEGCEAVLFSELTMFEPYGTLTVGWRFRLVDTRSGKVLWSADEVFDGGIPAVAAGARRYQAARREGLNPKDGWRSTRSPRLFGEYSAATLLATLPGR